MILEKTTTKGDFLFVKVPKDISNPLITYIHWEPDLIFPFGNAFKYVTTLPVGKKYTILCKLSEATEQDAIKIVDGRDYGFPEEAQKNAWGASECR